MAAHNTTNRALRVLHAALSQISQIPLPSRVGFPIARTAAETTKVMEVFDKVRLDLVKRYAEKDDAGEPKVDEEAGTYIMTDTKAFDKEFEELLDSEVEVQVFTARIAELQSIEVAPAVLVDEEAEKPAKKQVPAPRTPRRK